MPDGGKIGVMSRSDRVPLKPDYAAAARRRTGTPLVRAAAAAALQEEIAALRRC